MNFCSEKFQNMFSNLKFNFQKRKEKKEVICPWSKSNKTMNSKSSQTSRPLPNLALCCLWFCMRKYVED